MLREHLPELFQNVRKRFFGLKLSLREGSPAGGQVAGDLELPDGCSIFAVIRNERAMSVRSDTELQLGDKVIGIGRTECEGELHRILLGVNVDPD